MRPAWRNRSRVVLRFEGWKVKRHGRGQCPTGATSAEGQLPRSSERSHASMQASSIIRHIRKSRPRRRHSPRKGRSSIPNFGPQSHRPYSSSSSPILLPCPPTTYAEWACRTESLDGGAMRGTSDLSPTPARAELFAAVAAGASEGGPAAPAAPRRGFVCLVPAAFPALAGVGLKKSLLLPLARQRAVEEAATVLQRR